MLSPSIKFGKIIIWFSPLAACSFNQIHEIKMIIMDIIKQGPSNFIGICNHSLHIIVHIRIIQPTYRNKKELSATLFKYKRLEYDGMPESIYCPNKNKEIHIITQGRPWPLAITCYMYCWLCSLKKNVQFKFNQSVNSIIISI